jgi:hypothetical protein
LCLVVACLLLTAGCASSLYVEPVSEGKYLVDIYRLPDKKTAEQRWREEINAICEGRIAKHDVTITLETYDGPVCNTCEYANRYKVGTYTAWGTVECEAEKTGE